MSEYAHAVAATNSPSKARQLRLLLGLWWRHMRRRARRPGEAPRLSGVPTAFLLNLVVTGYTLPLVWSAVVRSMKHDPAFFAWHIASVSLISVGNGASQAAAGLKMRGMRNDEFLDALPVTPLARIGLQLADGFTLLPMAIATPLAAQSARGAPALSWPLPALLGVCAYVACFVVAQAIVVWARVLGPPATVRGCSYAGVGAMIVGAIGAYVPIGQFLHHAGAFAAVLTHAWLDTGKGLAGLFAGALALTGLGYGAVLGAERAGYDRLDAQPRPAAHSSDKAQDRNALEWLMLMRHGGRVLLIVSVPIGVGAVWTALRWIDRAPPELLAFPAGMVVYMGALQVIALAGRAARNDLMARSFLAPLPLAPYQVLDGKSRALRKLLIPVLAIVAALAAVAIAHRAPGFAYRMFAAGLSLYVVVEGAVAIAFLSNGIGVVGVGGGQASSSFSTQLLMMPLLATVLAADAWAGTVACIACVAVTHEARRAARHSVRWLDDPSDDIERETTVWRGLLAATAFFAVQAMAFRLLELSDTPPGYSLAGAFAASGLLLALLTWRNGARFARPRFLPRAPWWWPLGPIAGGISGAAALAMMKVLPARAVAETDHVFSTGEVVAVAITLCAMAPLVEEYFFRGWLQKAIEQDLPERHKRWAFALGALAFALAHIGMYGVPQLVLGLLAGALYAAGGGLWPAILAHAVHNGIVLLVGSQ